jgi:hypothetical protein
MWTIPAKSFARTARLPTHLGVPGEKQPKEMSGRDLRVT